MIDPTILKTLRERRNLLAFSAGVDSSALFFLLIEHHIPFDIALVNYGTRETSQIEEDHAKALAENYQLKCHTIQAPKLATHFESQARAFRYCFFEDIITKEGYDTLLTAHQLNDQLEWLLMRLTKGAGVCELVGLEPVSQRENYLLVRPLLSTSKSELISYLEVNGHSYFVDESNGDETYERNYFRKHFSDALIKEYQEGIKRSFDYIREDKARLEGMFETIVSDKKLRIIKLRSLNAKGKAADRTLKELGYLLSHAQRQEVENQASSVIGGEWAVELRDDLLYIAPYMRVKLPKVFKEQCRVARIPAKIRGYCLVEGIEISCF